MVLKFYLKDCLNLLGLVLFVLSWYLINLTSTNIFIPSPDEVFVAIFQELNSGMLQLNLSHSLTHILYGCLIGIPFGVLLATFSALYPKFNSLNSWVFALLRPIPPIAWIPIIIGAFGIKSISATIVISVGVVWTVYLTTLSGIQAISHEYFELATIFGRQNKLYLFLDIILPASFPAILAGVRTAIGQSVTLVVAAELFGITGIGQRMWESSGLMQMDIVVAYMFLIGVVYLVFDKFFNYFERSIFKWRKIV